MIKQGIMVSLSVMAMAMAVIVGVVIDEAMLLQPTA